MIYVRKQKVGGITFLRIHVAQRNFIVALCRTKKTHVIYA